MGRVAHGKYTALKHFTVVIASSSPLEGPAFPPAP
jgi:hypothetical protein